MSHTNKFNAIKFNSQYQEYIMYNKLFKNIIIKYLKSKKKLK